METEANQAQQVWVAPGVYAAAKRIINACPTSQKFSNIKPVCELGSQPWASLPFQRLQVDYADIPAVCGYKHLLVVVDQLSDGWRLSQQEMQTLEE